MHDSIETAPEDTTPDLPMRVSARVCRYLSHVYITIAPIYSLDEIPRSVLNRKTWSQFAVAI